jgi:hypothetical protein
MERQTDSDVRATVEDLRQRLGELEARHRDLLRDARRRGRSPLVKAVALVALAGTALLASSSLLYGQGDALFIDPTGRVGVGTTAPLGKLDIQGGADSTGANDPQALALSYRTGGYRHWIRTRHNAAAGAGNAIEFFVNNSAGANDSKGPGTGSVRVMTLEGTNVGVAGAITAQGFTAASGVSMAGIQNAVNVSVPIGTIMAYGGDTANATLAQELAKQGWLPCNGGIVSRQEYGELFGAIQTAFGTDNAATFRLPDLRGRFPRGVDQNAGRDPDRGGRGASAGGGNGGDRVGSVQDDMFGRHTHGYDQFPNSRGGIASGNYWQGGRVQTDAAGGNETRPKNLYVNWIIKAKHLLPVAP